MKARDALLALVVAWSAPGCTLDCEETTEQVWAEIRQTREQHLACSRDEDCVLEDVTNDCFGACPVVVAASGRAALRDQVARSNQDHCGGAFRTTCGYSTPSCVEIKAVCQQGACAAIQR